MTPREIDIVLGQLAEIKAQLGRVEEHAERTNGRVSELEKWRAYMQGAKWALSWLPTLATGVISGCVVVAVGAVIAHI